MTSTFIAFAVASSASPAEASHYALGDVPSLVNAGDLEKLRAASLATTEDLLARAAKTKDRKALAKTTGLAPALLLDLARKCDLLRLKGVGPEMVLLLEAAGVRSIAELAKSDAGAVTVKAQSANQTKKISLKPPNEAQFQHWIGEARKLPIVLETR